VRKNALTKVMLITGASRGIGAATVRLAAARGYDVAVNFAASKAGAEAVVADIRKVGRKALAIRADVGEPDEIARLFATVDAEFGRLDAFFNNAGILGPAAKFVDIAPDRLQRIIAVNTTGAFFAAQAAVRRMSTQLGGKGGVIVNMSSMAARLGGSNEATDYAASKGAIDSLTIGLAKEVAAEGIRVNAVRPGLIDTDIHASMGLPDRVERNKGLVPMQRGGRAEEVAEAVLWLCSDQSSYCTGLLLDIAGGRGL
jgi:NAD(P)-dependent dehydrogenase (short-subunit alcohol dehydrogenase family)